MKLFATSNLSTCFDKFIKSSLLIILFANNVWFKQTDGLGLCFEPQWNLSFEPAIFKAELPPPGSLDKSRKECKVKNPPSNP